MSETLKPCPFCGGEPKMVVPYNAPSWSMIECRHYDACSVCPQVEEEGDAAAIAAWNTRPEDPELAALRKELADLIAEHALCLGGLLTTETKLAQQTKNTEEARAQRDKAIKLLCDVLGSDYGPDIDAYLDGHVQPPCVEVLIKRLAEVVCERDEARAKLAELREAALEVGKVYLGSAWTPGVLESWNALVDKLRADAAAKEESKT